jgi:hypothetical protein
MDPATIAALILAGSRAIAALADALATVHAGGTISPEQQAVIDGELAAARARNDAAINAALAAIAIPKLPKA